MNISLGPLTFHMYGLIIGVAILLGWYLAKKRAHLYKISQSTLDDPTLLIPLILGIAGARLYHVLDYLNFYRQNPGQILSITSGGLGIWGALGGISLGFWIIAKVKNIKLLSILDLVAPSLLLGQAIGRIGNFINQEGFGPPTSLPWGVYIAPENRPIQFINSTNFHPTFFYEAILDGLFFILLIILTKRFKLPGQIFGLYLAFYAAGRFTVEFWRIDTWTVGTIKIAHVLSVIAIAVGIWFLIRRAKPTHGLDTT
ncbi:prolipoprotein diacylglyceryl transferase [Candidatus Curtissbacteria bacterium]|nr:prolipoprotein diacylglyceryl transferase [Candidatus Curtissbacteria bacterium]